MRARPLKMWLILAGALVLASPASASSMTGPAPDGLRIQLKPLGYNEVVSFYAGRGSEGPVIERYARGCVLRVRLQNEGSVTISTGLDEWDVLASGQSPQRIEGRRHWMSELERSRPSHEARMAFEWSQLPQSIDLDPGDSVQGLVSLPMQRGIEFDLVIRWRSGGRKYEQSIRGLGCR